MKLALFIASLALFRMPAQAAVLYELDPEIRAKTEQLLREKNRDYHHEAAIRLRDKGEHFDRARVEVTGMFSKDDTYRFNTEDFDDQIKPSHSNDRGRSVWSRLRTYGDDKKEMEQAMRGEMSKRAKATVAPFKNLEINEIVAHSWGTELVYAAILNGDLRPPKKLIVAGVPDDDRAKWKMLAERTGVELYWARADNDVAVLEKGVKIAKEAARGVDFKAKWDAVCANDAKNRICHPRGRKSKPMIDVPIGRLSGFIAHDRAAYYGVLKTTGIIKNTVGQLRALETKRINLEAAKIEQEVLEEAHREATALVSQAREQIAIARRDHDNRLKGMMIDIAVRACTAPERVNQAELDALPEPNDADFVNIGPDIADDCVIWVYRDLRRGVDLMSIRNRAASFAEPVAARPIPPSPVDTGRRVTNFLFMLPGVKDFAVAACRSPGQVAIPDDVTRPYGDIRFIPTEDDRETVRLSSGLGVCEARLFHRLVELIRGGYGPRIDTQWVIGAVRAYTPAPSYSDPTPQHYTPPPSHGDPCRDNGNIRCP